MKKIAIVMAAALSFGLLAGCRPTDFKKALGDWQLVHFEKDGVAQTIAISTLNIEEDEAAGSYSVSGFSGVNRFHGAYVVKGKQITVPVGFASTRMAGSPEAMEFESLFLRAMQSPSAWSVVQEDGLPMLVIESGAEAAKLSFRPLGVHDAVWKLSAVNVGNAVVSVEIANGATEALPMLEFSRDGAVSGTTGVNSIYMDYEIDMATHELTIAPGAVTLALTADENAERLEREFLHALAEVRKYSISGDTLHLLDENGTTLLTFQKQDFVL
ncbi:MAG: META domain-containing protein [Treponemataceae bacterium]|nr:META domain-containing protein [Treponemataceae bacterium]